MKTVQKLKIFSLMMAMPFVTNADIDCPPGHLFTVVGSSVTISQPPSHLLVQAGTIHLELREHPLDRDPKYEFDCELAGELVGQTATGQQLLNHQAVCPNNSFSSTGDLVTATGSNATVNNPYPSYLYVTEVVSTFVQGTGLFTNMSGVITATGTVDLIDPWKNEFTLEGEVCLKGKKK